MEINLYLNHSAENVCDKELTNQLQISGTFKGATSLIEPTIVIQRGVPTGFNYFYIPLFSRYYFLTAVSVVVNNLVSITGRVDIAMSYKNEFRTWNAVVSRNENRYNVLLNDGVFKAYQNSKHKVLAFPREMTDFSYILALGGNS